MAAVLATMGMLSRDEAPFPLSSCRSMLPRGAAFVRGRDFFVDGRACGDGVSPRRSFVVSVRRAFGAFARGNVLASGSSMRSSGDVL